jgi:hypothetical protein
MIKKLFGIIIGLVLILAPLFDWMTNSTGWNIGPAALTFFLGGLVWFLMFV